MQSKRKKSFTDIVFRLVFLAVCGYLLYQVILCQVAISSRRQELRSVQTQLLEQQAINEELTRELDSGTEQIIERAARDDLGYAKPNERVFVDISGK